MEQLKGRGYGKLWNDLRDNEKLSPKAKFIYAIMGSFGPQSRASVGRIAKSAGMKEETVRAAQRELIEAGWLVLVKEGNGGQDGKGAPRVWWLNDVPFQHQFDPATRDEVTKAFLEGPLQRGGSPPGGSLLEGGVNKKSLNKKTERPPEESSASGILTKDRAMKSFLASWRLKMGPDNEYRVTPAEHAQLSRFLKESCSDLVWNDTLKAYLATKDRFIADKGWPLLYLLSQWNTWAVGAQRGAKEKGAPEMTL